MVSKQAVHHYLAASGRLPGLGGPDSVSFLAAGEYNENWLVETARGRFVLRINHGSQIGMGERQIEYEYTVLQALARSGVTPRPFFRDPAPPGLPGGALLMEYLPGRPLDYVRDRDKAARVFARTHAQPTHPGLLVQDHPVRDIAAESIGLIERYPDHPLAAEQGARLRDHHAEIEQLARDTSGLFKDEPMVIVNTEVNSHNFIVDRDAAWLVDWEKAVVSHRYQDLGHFLVSTTTRWKAGHTYPERDKLEFLRRYLELSGLGMGLDEVRHKTAVLERTILLRALSWCYMAYCEYTRPGRALRNADTFATIRTYLDELECLLP